MGFGDTFVSYIKILYRDAESMVKVCGSLTSPFPFLKGIRQGCPLSGLLYAIAIEPFLNTLRKNLHNQSFPLPDSQKFCAVSAYADDVSIFVTSDSGFNTINEAYTLYSSASAARLNLQKSQGLWVGPWTRRNDKPLGFKWNNEGLPFLGVHLGNSHFYTQQNWIHCKEKLSKTLAKWTYLSFSLSFKGKVLIANQLAASKVNHILAALSPPDNILGELQGMLVDFVWSYKRHLLRQQLLFQKPDRGGLGLVCLQARMLTYRFSTLQRFLNQNTHPANALLGFFFRQYKKLHLDYNLFYTDIDPKSFSSLPVYHSDILCAWKESGAHTVIPLGSINRIINLPISSTVFKLSPDNEESCSRLLMCEIKLVRSLLDDSSGNWLTSQDIALPPLNLYAARHFA